MKLETALGAVRLAAYLGMFAPRPPAANTISLDQRLAALPTHGAPVSRPVVIRWNAHHVPFIEAQSDRDLAVALGIVHAHLRLGQIEAFRRISAGRMSEMVGPVALGLDHTLRIFDFGGPVPDILRELPEETRSWLDGFVEGINHVLFAAAPPHEFALFELRREPWTVGEVLRLGRLFASDGLWLVWLRLLGIRRSPEWRGLWAKLVGAGALKVPEPAAAMETAALQALLGANNRSGSNALAVGAKRSENGAAWLAGDPHLSLSLPGNWLLLGYRSPSHEAVGLMIPGLPLMAIGRNPLIAWGGTSLHGHMTELCNTANAGKDGWSSREEVFRPRWSHSRRLKVRTCDLGPILSDSEFYNASETPLALRWVGHHASDEYTSMLAVSRARDWSEFRSALRGFAVPGLNMVYADAKGNTGHALAAWVPNGALPVPDDLVNHEARGSWCDFLNSAELPARFNPESGFVVSANGRPDGDVVVGHLFSSRDRADRITRLLEAAPRVGFRELAAIQTDVQVDAAQNLARMFARAARSGPGSPPNKRCAEVLALLETWDGNYNAQSRGAAAFELMLFAFARAFHSPDALMAYHASWALRDLIRADVESGDESQVAVAARRALHWVSRRLGTRRWGDLHRLRLNYPLGAFPLAGRPYRYCDLPSSGGSDTVMKTANGLVSGRHSVRYGANARYIFDMSDVDGNYFVMLGGQDGSFGSTTFADQVEHWRRSAYVQLPLRRGTVARMFPHVTTLVPRQGNDPESGLSSTQANAT
ncbi:MAG TPA: penicillin acylase family protein [Rhizomicrobium sp.]|jgi:penicillin amidase|nr:penicillin acylase family protein [Rhizomicrobium sp.]